MNKYIGIGIIIVALVGSFFIGVSYGKGKATGPGATRNAAGSQFNGMRGGTLNGARVSLQERGGGSFVAGEIISKDDSSITVKLQTQQSSSTTPIAESGSRIIFFSGSTDIGKEAKGAASDLTIGTTVTVTGAQNVDGSITAKSIQIRSPLPVGR